MVLCEALGTNFKNQQILSNGLRSDILVVLINLGLDLNVSPGEAIPDAYAKSVKPDDGQKAPDQC